MSRDRFTYIMCIISLMSAAFFAGVMAGKKRTETKYEEIINNTTTTP